MTEPTVTVSDGNNFFQIPFSDLQEALADNFYLPSERGNTIVSDGKELFEIPLTDVAAAQADGFKDLLITERQLLAARRNERQSGPAPATPTPVPKEQVPSPAPVQESATNNSGDTVVDRFPESYAQSSADTVVETNPPPSRQHRPPGDVQPTVASQPRPTTQSVQATDSEARDTEPKTLRHRFHLLLHPAPEQLRKRRVLLLNTAIHSAVLAILAGILLPSEELDDYLVISSSIAQQETIEEPMETIEIEQPIEVSDSTPPAEVLVDTYVESMETVDVDINDLELATVEATVDLNSSNSSAKISTQMGGRSRAGRATMVAKMGGTAASEKAVQLGLRWIADHQQPDGGWSFDHTGAKCTGACSQPGSLKGECRNASTGLAILALLGAGHTPTQGDFQDVVYKGVEYLLKNSSPVPAGVDMRGIHGNNTGMYTHAIAATALCETVAMLQHEVEEARGVEEERSLNKKRSLILRQIAPIAAASIQFIVNAQHSPTGGWGYNPGAAGDTSILGWQVMALKSASHARIPFSIGAVVGANKFLSSVQNAEGMYGYRDNKATKPSTTAIGIVCRMLSGVPRTEPRLVMGVRALSAKGPDRNSMYFNYYATQAMMNYGGETWRNWNESMREHLVATQVSEGHAAGSWDPRDAHAGRAGRLFMTCLCTMTLEVYYRHLPLYGTPDDYEMTAAQTEESESSQPETK